MISTYPSRTSNYASCPSHSLDVPTITSAAFRSYLSHLLQGLNPLHLYTDASKAQAGAILQHEGRQIWSFSRALTTSDRGSCLREAQAFLRCLQHIPRHLLRLSTVLIVRTDRTLPDGGLSLAHNRPLQMMALLKLLRILLSEEPVGPV